LPREHLEIEVASIVQANPVDNVNVTDIIQVAVPSPQVSECVQQFREFKHNCRQKQSLIEQLTMRVHTYPLSSAECERGFSALNRSQTPARNKLKLETLKLV